MSNIPAGYKHTEVGIIPEDWEAVRMSTLANIQRGASPRPIDSPIWFDNQSSTGWLRISDVTKAKKYLTETTQNLSDLGIANSRFVEQGNLVMSICATVGRPILTHKDVCIHDGFVVFNGLKVDKEYLYYVLTDIEKNWSKHGQTGSQMNLNTGLINSTPIPFPPTKAEQTAIATVLCDADALIQSLEKLVAKKRDIKQGAMQELLKPKEGWVVKKLGEVGSFSKGQGIRKDECMSGTISCVRYGELYTRHNDYVKQYYSFISESVAQTAKKLKPGDILFAGSGETKEEIGKCAAFIDNIEAYAGGDIVILSPVNVDSLFLGFYLNTPFVVKQKASKGQGDAVVHISAGNLKDIEIPLPPLAEQTRIATILSDMDAEIAALETKLAKYKQIKQGMMQELLTGKTRLV